LTPGNTFLQEMIHQSIAWGLGGFKAGLTPAPSTNDTLQESIRQLMKSPFHYSVQPGAPLGSAIRVQNENLELLIVKHPTTGMAASIEDVKNNRKCIWSKSWTPDEASMQKTHGVAEQITDFVNAIETTTTATHRRFRGSDQYEEIVKRGSFT
jgi:hypothetical protein